MPFIILLLITIFFILIDEMILSLAQRRVGPMNIGFYGIITTVLNGININITQLITTKLQMNYGFQIFPIMLMVSSLISYNVIYPFFLIDNSLSLLVSLVISSLSFIFIILSALSSNSKYSMLSSIRLISQLISFELIFITLSIIIAVSSDDILFINYYWLLNVYILIIGNSIFTTFYLVLYYFLFNVIFFISILAEYNRTPFDIPEAESELVAGFMTEYSSIYFSIIVLTEYAGIIINIWALVSLLSNSIIFYIIYLIVISTIRSSLTRLKYDELISTSWLIFIPISFCLLLYSIL